MAKIEDLLQRRTDLSTFLVHLTRAGGGKSAFENLQSLIENLMIEARSPFGPAAEHEAYLGGSAATQKAVCFSETPLEHVWMMLEDIDGRTVQFEPYGIVITKTTGRKAGFNPVWYSDISRRGVDWPAKAINQLIEEAVEAATDANDVLDAAALAQQPIFKVTPFFEQMGPIKDGRKEFWWEREWRKVDDFYMSFPSRVVAVLAPEADHVELERFLAETSKTWARRPILDPRWGLERMIVALARVPDEHVGPFPDAY